MSDSLFRGLTTQKPEGHEFNHIWVEGDLIISGGKYYIHPRANKVRVEGEMGRLIVMHEVIPETVGQFIGLSDITGKKGFSGDIIKTRHGIRQIVFEDGCFGARANARLFGDMRQYNRELGGAWKVIGNIHDNPELLEVSL